MVDAVQAVVEIIVPGAGPAVVVLGWIFELCEEVKECRESCILTHGRLQMILDELQRMVDNNTMPPSDAVNKYVGTLTVLWTDLAPYKEMPFFERLLRHKKLKNTIVSVNEDVDALFRMLAIATTGAMMDWKLQWDADVQQQNEMMHELVRNNYSIMKSVDTLRMQMETMLLLKSELDKKVPDQPKEVQELLQKSFRTISTNSRAEVPAVPIWFIEESRITYFPKFFARGSFGTVHRGTYDNAEVVVKMLVPEGQGLAENLQPEFLKEANMWFGFHHPNVVKMYGACHISSHPFIVCEYAENGNLAEYLSKQEPKRRLWKAMHEAALGLKFLHGQKVVHGDLKLNNILVTKDGSVRLADFGLSRVKTSSKSKMSKLPSGVEVSGGLHWLAPERFEFQPQFVSDIYALGMCIIEAALGDAPFGTLDSVSVRQRIIAGRLPSKPESLSDEGWILVQKMTKKEPQARISLDEAIAELQRLMDLESQQISEFALFCDPCNRRQQDKARFCDQCGLSLSGDDSNASGGASKPRPVKSLLANLDDPSMQLTSAKLLYRQAAAERSICADIKTRNGTEPLLKAAAAVDNFACALYAFGSLEALRAVTSSPSAEILEPIREALDNEVVNNVDAILALLNAEDESARDVRQAAELSVLAVRLHPSNQNALAAAIPALAGALEQSSTAVRDAILSALVALTTSADTPNLDAVRDANVTASLLEALASGSSTSQQCALDLLVKLTESYSSAQSCGSRQGIRALVARLDDGDDAIKEKVLKVLSNVAQVDTMPEQLGRLGTVSGLVELLLQDTTAKLKHDSFKTLSVLVAVPANGVMFELAGGVDALKQILESTTPESSEDVLGSLAKFVENDQLRAKIISDTALVQQCLQAFATKDPSVATNATRVLGALAKGNPSVVRKMKQFDGLLPKLARRKDEFAITTILSVIDTLLEALPSDKSGIEPSLGNMARAG